MSYQVRASELNASHVGLNCRFVVDTERPADHEVVAGIIAVTFDEDYAESDVVKVGTRDGNGDEFTWDVSADTYVTLDAAGSAR